MGYCVDNEDTPYKMSFEIRRESVIFDCDDGDGKIVPIEICKSDLLKIKGLICDSAWAHRLLPPNDQAYQPDLVCSVVNQAGKHCPDEPTHTVEHNGKQVALCNRCFCAWKDGAYGEHNSRQDRAAERHI